MASIEESEMDQKESINIGVVGLGHLHPRLYMPLFQMLPSTQVVAAVDSDSTLLDSFCREFSVQGFSDLEVMLEECAVDAVSIFLPHSDCPAAASLCAAAGVHLMVEKPMASDAAGAAKILQAAAENQVKLTTGYCWRMHPAAREFKRLIQSGIIGNPVGAEGRCAAGRLQRYIDGNASWMLQRSRSGGGPMFNLGVHWIDLFCWIFEDEVREVCGQNVQVNSQYDIEDNSFALLRFDSGVITSLDISYTVPDSFPYGRDLYLSVRGTEGAISWAPAYEGQKDVLFVCSDHSVFAGAPRRELAFELEPVNGYSGFMGLEYARDFAEAVLRDREPAITGQDGLRALHVVEAIYRSTKEKCWTSVHHES
jgi:predicted dehydrogenase